MTNSEKKKVTSQMNWNLYSKHSDTELMALRSSLLQSASLKTKKGWLYLQINISYSKLQVYLLLLDQKWLELHTFKNDSKVCLPEDFPE